MLAKSWNKAWVSLKHGTLNNPMVCKNFPTHISWGSYTHSYTPFSDTSNIWWYGDGCFSNLQPRFINPDVFFSVYNQVPVFDRSLDTRHDKWHPRPSRWGAGIWCLLQGGHHDLQLHHWEFAENSEAPHRWGALHGATPRTSLVVVDEHLQVLFLMFLYRWNKQWFRCSKIMWWPLDCYTLAFHFTTWYILYVYIYQ